jgi:hypothetical protein
LAALALLGAPAAARADGDPASDVLLSADAYLPYFPPPAKQLSATLVGLLKRTARNGYPMKVAVIAGRGDLGAYPDLFGQPQRYADLLSSEIAFSVRKPHLLVVMPGGFGGENLGPKVDQALNGISLPASGDSDALASAAIQAVAKLASVNGHPTPVPRVSATAASGGGGGGSSHTAEYVGAALFVVCGVGLALLLARRRTPAAPE